MTKDGFLGNWMTGGAATREAFRRDVEAMLEAERERCAQIVARFPSAEHIATHLRELGPQITPDQG